MWFDPELWVGYRPRGSWRALAKQYYEYGFWKAQVLRLHPESLRARQLVPPVAVCVASAAMLVAFCGKRRALVAPAAYLGAAALTASSTQTTAAILSLHVSWSVGLLRGFTNLRRRP